MFTIGAFIFIGIAGFIAMRQQDGHSDQMEVNIKHSRQDAGALIAVTTAQAAAVVHMHHSRSALTNETAVADKTFRGRWR
jgi:hypothetical protein